MRLFEWSYDHRAFDPYRRVFTGDFRFVMTLQDSNGAGYRDDSWLYEDEMVSARHLFEGGGPQPAATRIALDLDPVLVFVDDPRPGKDPWFHKTTSTHFALKVRTRGNRMYDISGFADFYLVRGDSAAVPVGEPPADSTRWFIERWEDRSLNGDWGALKRAYR
jgi:hypothetical protein